MNPSSNNVKHFQGLEMPAEGFMSFLKEYQGEDASLDQAVDLLSRCDFWILAISREDLIENYSAENVFLCKPILN